MNRIRGLFPVTAHWAYLNHCGASPLALPVSAAMESLLLEQQQHGTMHYGKWQQKTWQTRRKAAALMGARAEEVAFVRSTLDGVSFVAEGLDWREGDNVVTVQGEYPANVYPWLNLRSRGVECRLAPDRVGRVLFEDIQAAIDGRTRLVALSFVEFTNGFRNDLAATGSFCRDRGILFFVDAIQGLGALPLDVEALQIDFLASGGHKWLLGPHGVGVFYCRNALVDRLRLVRVGPESMLPRAEYLPYEFSLRGDALRFEGGTLNYAGIYGLGAALDLLSDAGITAIERHIMGLLDYAVEGLRLKGCEILSSLAPAERSGIVAFQSNRMDAPKLVKRLIAAGVAVTARSGGIRVAPHLYNDRDDIDRLLCAIP